MTNPTKKKPKGKFLTVRLQESSYKAFIARAAKFDGTSVVLRELIEAFVEDRLTIKAPANKESLYHA